MKRQSWCHVILLVGCLTLCSCFFDPRSPETPATGQEIFYLPRDEADKIVENMQTAFRALDASGYDDAVGENFTYEPDGETLASFPGVAWDDWDREQEISFINRLFTDFVAIEMALPDSVISIEEPTGGEERWDIIYLMSLTTNTGSVVKYRGRAALELRLIGSFWYVDKWIDENGETDPETGSLLATMGSVRGNLASKKP